MNVNVISFPWRSKNRGRFAPPLLEKLTASTGMIPFSILDLSPITEGSDAGQALRNSLDLARHVEALGYRRFWMAEHHNLPGIASAATAVALAHVAAVAAHEDDVRVESAAGAGENAGRQVHPFDVFGIRFLPH
jgi:hypothetical protein